MTYNVITELCYGESVDLFKSTDMRWFPLAVATVSRRVVMVCSMTDFNTNSKLMLMIFI